MKKERKDFVLNINKTNNYCTNVSNPQIAPLYNYFRRRVGAHNFPISDKQRYQFDKMIVNLCTERFVYVEHWVLYNYFNIYNRPQWWESASELIETRDGPVPYQDIKDELKLICKLMKAYKINYCLDLTDIEQEKYQMVTFIDKSLLNLEKIIKKEA